MKIIIEQWIKFYFTNRLYLFEKNKTKSYINNRITIKNYILQTFTINKFYK